MLERADDRIGAMIPMIMLTIAAVTAYSGQTGFVCLSQQGAAADSTFLM